jgi:PAS domain S-box-containing protein
MPSDAVPRDKRDIILVVEDDPGIGALIGDLLTKDGWETELLRMGRDALARLETIRPILVLLDYILPDMNGKDFVARAASMPPFIIVTGMGDERIAVEMMKSGARDYLIKDRNFFDVLPRTVRRILEQIDSERRLAQANRALRESEERYRLLFQNANDAIYVHGISPEGPGKFIEVNDQACRMLGYTREEFLDMSIPDIDVPEQRERVPSINRALYATGRAFFQTEQWSKDRRRIPEEVSACLFELQGKNLVLAVVRDITERKRAEEEINRLLEAERRKISELTHSNALIAALSHVAARAGAAADPDQVMDTIGDQLRTLDLDCLIALYEPDAQVFSIHYVSVPEKHRSVAERFAHSKMIGFQIKASRLKAYADVIEGRRSVFLEDTRAVAFQAVPQIPKLAFQKALEAIGIGPATLAAALPLAVDNEVLGFMVLWGAGLRETDLPVFSAFASQISITLRQTNLFIEIQNARRQLEILSTQLLDAQENERRKLATELHDNIGQVFTAVKTNLQAFQLAAAQPGLRPRLDESINAVSIALDQVRTLALELRPSVLDDFGLVAALNWYLERLAARSGFAAEFRADPPDVRLPAMLETTIFRLAQAALTNVERHAKATRVKILLTESDKGPSGKGERCVEVVVRDNGKGFRVSSALKRASQGRSLGLLGMQERTRLAGGEIRIESKPGRGTEVRAWFPITSGKTERLP